MNSLWKGVFCIPIALCLCATAMFAANFARANEVIQSKAQATNGIISWSGSEAKVTGIWNSSELQHQLFIHEPAVTSIKFDSPNTTWIQNDVTTFETFYGLSSLQKIVGTVYFLPGTSAECDLDGLFTGDTALKSVDELRFSNEFKFISFLHLFENCTNLETVGKINLDKARELSYMFHNCSSLKTVDLHRTSYLEDNINVGTISMFEGCAKLESISTSTSEAFSLAHIINSTNMFSGCLSLKSLNLSSTKGDAAMYSNNRVMTSMFYNCISLKQISAASFSLNQVSDMSNMFSGCSVLEKVNLNRDITTRAGAQNAAGTMENMFFGCNKLTSIADEESSFTLANVSSTKAMFKDCTSLEDANLVRNLDTVATLTVPTNMESMFEGCTALTEITREKSSNFFLDKASNLNSMFKGCTSLNDIRLTRNTVSTSETTTMDSMFENCTGLTNLDLSSFSDDNITSATNVFSGCTNLVQLNIRNWLNPDGTFVDTGLFSGCTNLKELVMSTRYLPTQGSAFPYSSAWFAQAGGQPTSSYPITGYDAFKAFEEKYPATSLNLWLAVYTSFDANGGQFLTGDKTVHTLPAIYDEPIERVQGSQMTYPGYTFLGWSADKDATTPTYDPTDESESSNWPVAEEAPKTLYAVWEQSEKTVTFNAGEGASYLTETTTGLMKQRITLPQNPTKQGYEFLGWGATPSATEILINPSDQSTYPTYETALDLYHAVWVKQDEAVFMVNLEGATFPDGSELVYEQGDAGASIPEPFKPTCQYYTFKGWADTSDATEPNVFPPYGTTPTFGSEQNQFYGVWEEVTKTVTFHSGDGKWSDGASEKPSTGSATSLVQLPEAPIREGYDFVGWGASKSTLEVLIDPDDAKTDPYYADALSDYWAVWIANATVVFDAGEDALFPNTHSQTWKESGLANQQISIPEKDPIKPYFMFQGWASTPSAQEPDFPTDPANYPTFSTSQRIWYAVWKPAGYSVLFNANGGTFADGGKSETENGEGAERLVLPDAPTRAGYKFLGWSKTQFDQTIDIDPSSTDPLPYYGDCATQYWAVWQQLELTVTFHAGDGVFAGGEHDTTQTGFAESELTLPQNPTLEHYVFAGWAKTQGALTPDITPGQKEALPKFVDASENYYAVWHEDDTVYFSAEPGGMFPDQTKVMYTEGQPDDTINLPRPNQEPERYAYSFEGWATTKGATTPDVDPDNLPKYSEVNGKTYYAVWKELSRTITFNANGSGAVFAGGDKTATTEGLYSEFLKLPANPTRAGYGFVGYAAAADATIPDIIPGTESTYPTYETAKATYYAVWVADKTVIFSTDGGAFPDKTTEWSEVGSVTTQIQLPKEEPSRQYYKFDGWSSLKDATTPELDPNNLPTFADAKRTYYAVWDPLAKTVTFDAFGGEFADKTTTEVESGEQDTYMTYPSVPTRLGYTFLGWSTTQTEQTITIDPKDPATLPKFGAAASNYYAVWSENWMTVTFNAGADGTFDGGSQTVTTSGYSQNSLKLPTNPAKEHYTFAGWAKTDGATIPDITPGQTEGLPLYIQAAETYFAVWRKDNEVHFSARPGGVFPDGSVSYMTEGTPEQTIKLPAGENVPQRSGYKLIGWATTEGATTPELDPSSLPTYGEVSGVTYFAVWEELTNTITFDANGDGATFPGGATQKQVTGPLSESILLPDEPTRAGYGFVGWAPTKTATRPQIVPEDISTYPNYGEASKTYYAVWVANKHIIFYAGSGEFPQTHSKYWSEDATAGEQIGVPEPPQLVYFTFIGWSSLPGATTPEFVNASDAPLAENAAQYYYAIWDANEQVVNFHANGGEYSDGSDTVSVHGDADQTVKLPTSPKREDYTFGGWALTKDAKQPTIIPSDADTYPTYAEALAAGGNYYAFWLSEEEVMFNAGIGKFPDGDRVKVMVGDKDDPIMVPSQNPEAPNYEFRGWTDVEGGDTPNLPHPYPTYGQASEIYYAVYEHTSAHWVIDDTGTRYMDSNGNFLQGEWATIDGVDYYFKDDTYMANNGWLTIQGKDYYFYSDGSHATGWVQIDGTWYYFGEDGFKETGWIMYAGQWYYLNQDGSIATGWLYLNGQTYYLALNDGAMVEDWQWIDDAWYYFEDGSGEMYHYVWSWIGNGWYYFEGDGRMCKSGWFWIETAWYVFDNSGVMYKDGWYWIVDAWYYLGYSGDMYRGWQWLSNAWYYLGDDGWMRTGWLWDGGWYYLTSSGNMVTNKRVDGYWVNKSGLWRG